MFLHFSNVVWLAYRSERVLIERRTSSKRGFGISSEASFEDETDELPRFHSVARSANLWPTLLLFHECSESVVARLKNVIIYRLPCRFRYFDFPSIRYSTSSLFLSSDLDISKRFSVPRSFRLYQGFPPLRCFSAKFSRVSILLKNNRVAR